jgi:hypothetical protein
MSEPIQSRVPLYYAYGALGIQALLPIIAGSFASVKVSERNITCSLGFH